MAKGWYAYLNVAPLPGILVQFARMTSQSAEPGNVWVGTKANLGPESVGNLYWRLTGIGRMEMERRNLQVDENRNWQQQANLRNAAESWNWQSVANPIDKGGLWQN